MKVLRVLQAAQTLARLGLRRARRGPLDATWGWREELLIGLLRARFASARHDSIDRVRFRMESLRMPSPKLATWEEQMCGPIPAVLATPPSQAGSAILYLHGGGYSFGSYHSHRALIERLAFSAHSVVLAINYRLAPEHPCPAAIEDAVFAYRWLVAQGYAPDQIVLAGDSAGGALAMSALMALRDAGDPMPAGGIGLSPWLDLTASSPSHDQNFQTDYVAAGGNLMDYARQYAGDLPLDDPRVSPIFGDLHGLPPLLLHAGEAEVMRDEIVRFGHNAEASGVDVRLQVWPAQVHVWHVFSGLLRSSTLALNVVAQFVHEVTAPERRGGVRRRGRARSLQGGGEFAARPPSRG
ncbi:MAG: alpha/beta hydrolase [Myxococcota bacterium]